MVRGAPKNPPASTPAESPVETPANEFTVPGAEEIAKMKKDPALALEAELDRRVRAGEVESSKQALEITRGLKEVRDRIAKIEDRVARGKRTKWENDVAATHEAIARLKEEKVALDGQAEELRQQESHSAGLIEDLVEHLRALESQKQVLDVEGTELTTGGERLETRRKYGLAHINALETEGIEAEEKSYGEAKAALEQQLAALKEEHGKKVEIIRGRAQEERLALVEGIAERLVELDGGKSVHEGRVKVLERRIKGITGQQKGVRESLTALEQERIKVEKLLADKSKALEAAFGRFAQLMDNEPSEPAGLIDPDLTTPPDADALETQQAAASSEYMAGLSVDIDTFIVVEVPNACRKINAALDGIPGQMRAAQTLGEEDKKKALDVIRIRLKGIQESLRVLSTDLTEARDKYSQLIAHRRYVGVGAMEGYDTDLREVEEFVIEQGAFFNRLEQWLENPARVIPRRGAPLPPPPPPVSSTPPRRSVPPPPPPAPQFGGKRVGFDTGKQAVGGTQVTHSGAITNPGRQAPQPPSPTTPAPQPQSEWFNVRDTRTYTALNRLPLQQKVEAIREGAKSLLEEAGTRPSMKELIVSDMHNLGDAIKEIIRMEPNPNLESEAIEALQELGRILEEAEGRLQPTPRPLEEQGRDDFI